MIQTETRNTLLMLAAQIDQHLTAAGAAHAQIRTMLKTAKRDGPNEIVPLVPTIEGTVDRAVALGLAHAFDLVGTRAARAAAILHTVTGHPVPGATIANATAAALAGKVAA